MGQPTAYYCDLADGQRVLSMAGVNARIDDDPLCYPYLVDEASRDMDFFLWPHYSEAALSSSRWVRFKTAVFLAVLFCERRGNPVPKGLARKYNRTVLQLEMVQANQAQIPGLSRRRTSVPTLSNVRTRLDPFPRTVIERKRSGSANKPTDYPRHDDHSDQFNDYQR